MALLDLTEIRLRLDEQFGRIEPMVSGLRFIPGGLSTPTIEALQRDLDVKFPADFSKAISEFDFGRLTIGPVASGNSGNYGRELMELNVKTHWWGGGIRPRGMLMIASSDPHAILLNAESGSVLAMDREGRWVSLPQTSFHGIRAYL